MFIFISFCFVPFHFVLFLLHFKFHLTLILIFISFFSHLSFIRQLCIFVTKMQFVPICIWLKNVDVLQSTTDLKWALSKSKLWNTMTWTSHPWSRLPHHVINQTCVRYFYTPRTPQGLSSLCSWSYVLRAEEIGALPMCWQN